MKGVSKLLDSLQTRIATMELQPQTALHELQAKALLQTLLGTMLASPLAPQAQSQSLLRKLLRFESPA